MLAVSTRVAPVFRSTKTGPLGIVRVQSRLPKLTFQGFGGAWPWARTVDIGNNPSAAAASTHFIADFISFSPQVGVMTQLHLDSKHFLILRIRCLITARAFGAATAISREPCRPESAR